MINRPGAGAGTNPADATDWKMGGVGSTNSMALIGTDLRDDHPVSIIYKDAKSYGTGGTIGTDSHAAGFTAATLAGTRPVVVKGSITLPLMVRMRLRARWSAQPATIPMKSGALYQAAASTSSAH